MLNRPFEIRNEEVRTCLRLVNNERTKGGVGRGASLLFARKYSVRKHRFLSSRIRRTNRRGPFMRFGRILYV